MGPLQCELFRGSTSEPDEFLVGPAVRTRERPFKFLLEQSDLFLDRARGKFPGRFFFFLIVTRTRGIILGMLVGNDKPSREKNLCNGNKRIVEESKGDS